MVGLMAWSFVDVSCGGFPEDVSYRNVVPIHPVLNEENKHTPVYLNNESDASN